MSPRSLLFLAVLVGLLGGFIYFFEKDLPSTGERQELEKKVLALKAEKVDALEIHRQGKTLRFAKEAKKDDPSEALAGSTWMLEDGGKSWRAAASQVDELVRQLTDLQQQRKFEKFDAEQTGLAKPFAEVDLKVDGKSHRLAIGEKLSLGESMLVGYGGVAYQVQAGAGLLDMVGKEPGDWREKLLFHDGRASIEKLTLPGPAGTTVLTRRGEGENFWIEGVPADLADRDLVAGLLTDISTLEAGRFLDEGAPGPVAPRRIEVGVKGRPDPFVLEIGAPAGDKSIARVDGHLVELAPKRLLAALDRPATGWRSTFWSPLQVFGIDHATFDQGGQKTEIHRIEGEWRRGAENQDNLDFAVASDALYPIVESKAQEVLTRAEAAARGFALDKPRLQIHLRTADAGEDLAVYPPVNGLAPATSSAREVVLLLPDDKVQELERKVAALRSAPASGPPAGASPPVLPAEGDEP